MNSKYSLKLILTSLFIFLSGCFFSIISFNLTVDTQIQVKSIEIFDSAHDFLGIFRNNLFIGLLISVGGYLSGGILAIITLFYNGYLLIDLIQSALILKIPKTEIIYGLIYHAPIELFALFLFSSIGLKGYSFYKKILFQNQINDEFIPLTRALLLPIFLLALAALIESNL